MPGVIIRTPTGWTLKPNPLSYAPTPSRDFASFQDYLTGKREYHNPWAEIWDNEELNELIRHRAKIVAFHPYRDAWDDFADISRLGHPRSAMATSMYQSMARRLEKSRFLVARLGDQTGVLCSGTDVLGGTCMQNYNYTLPGQIKFLTARFPDQEPLQFASTGQYISFEIAKIVESTTGKLPVYYGFNFEATYDVFLSSCTPSSVTRGEAVSPLVRGYNAFGPITPLVVYEPAPNNACSLAHAMAFFFITYSEPLLYREPACSPLRSPAYSTPRYHYVLFEASVRKDSFKFNYLSFRSCELPDNTYALFVYDDSGLIGLHEFFATTSDPNDSFPDISIESGSSLGGFKIQSQKYPYVWYSVPANYSSCECGDFNQKVTRPPSPIRAVRDWTGTNAGAFNPCKHIMKVKQMLGIQQNYNDYVPSREDERKADREARRQYFREQWKKKKKKRDFRG